MNASLPQLALIALLVVAILLIAYQLFKKYRREGFASKRAHEVHQQATELFARGGDASYTQYKDTVRGADPVQFNDVRNLHRTGRLTPEAVDQVL